MSWPGAGGPRLDSARCPALTTKGPRCCGRRCSAAAAAALITGCGGDDGTSDEAPVSVPLTFIQTARSGSFLGGNGAKQTLVLRGVGGAAALGAEGSGGGGSAGAIATAVLVRRAHQLLGSEPLQATLTGAEVIPQRYRLELTNPDYDGVRQELSFDATILDGNPGAGAAELRRGDADDRIEHSRLPADRNVSAVDPSVEGDEGEPLDGALISVSLGGLGLATAQSNADGSFSLGPLPAGSYVVEGSERGYRLDRADRTLPPGSDPLELELEAEEQVAQQG